MPHSKQIAVIGAGPMGLMCAYELLKQGHRVTLFERDDRIGGMSASFDFGGTKIERFYHFICATDYPLFNLLKELNLMHTLTWQDTKMGFYYEGNLYPWGDPLSLLKFPKLNLISKLRYGLHAFLTSKISNWNKLDKQYAHIWLKRWIGKKAYNVLWKSLFELKFYQYQNNLSAAWIGTRIKRVGKSRRNLLQESLGYLQGGSDTLLNSLEEKILKLGGVIKLNAKVDKIICDNERVTGLSVNNATLTFDTVVSTAPLPSAQQFIPTLDTEIHQKINNIINIGVACVLFKLKKPFSPYFWMNINDAKIPLPGLIEYTNLNPSHESILYVPYYMPHDHLNYRQPSEEFIKNTIRYLKKIKPEFNENEIIASQVTRYAYAQTVCSPGFYQQLPPMKTNITGFYMADTAYYYPEDRSISESVQVGKQLACQVTS